MTVRPYRLGPKLLLALLIACWACLGRASGQTVRVPQDQPTIQAGINAAVNGGTVLVSPGTPGAAASSVLTIVTSNAPNGVALDRPRFASGAVYAVSCLLILPFVRRRRIGRLFAIAVASAALLLCATGCETIAYQVSTVAPGTYIIPIRAADTAGNVAATDLTVVITQ